MLKLALVDMPFSLPECAAFGISQIKTYLDLHYQDQVQSNVFYLSHDFLDFFGDELYRVINADFYDYYKFDINKHLWVDRLRKSGLEVSYFGGMLGDWIFRQEVYDEKDNADDYFQTYYSRDDLLKNLVLEKRSQLHGYLKQVAVKYNLAAYDIVGFTSRFQQQMAALAMAKLLKRKNPNIRTLLGGPNCEPPAGAALMSRVDDVDFILSGRRFLIGFGQLINCLHTGQIRQIEDIPGLFTKQKCQSESVDYFEASEEDDINDLTVLDYDAYFDSAQRLQGRDIQPILFLETSRGCSWGEKKKCTFCAIDGYNPKHRFMSPAKAITYLNNVFDRYKDKCIYYVFVDSTMPKNYLRDVFPYVRIPDNALLLYECRVDFTPEEIELMAKFHIRLLIVGIESLSTLVLQLLNKGTTVFENIRFLKECRKHDIAVNWNILVGIPGETEEQLEINLQSIPFVKHLYPPTGVWLVSYQGNCEYNIHPGDFTIKTTPNIDSLSLLYPFPEKALKKMTYFYKNETSNLTRSKAVAIQRLAKASLGWKDAWYQAEKDGLPDLRYIGYHQIVDSRQEETIRLTIESVDAQILLFFEQEDTIENLIIKTGLPAVEAESRIRRLLEDRLLFQEGNRYLNLVLDMGTYHETL